MKTEEEIMERIDSLLKAIEENRDPNFTEEENALNSIPQIAQLVSLKWVLDNEETYHI